MFHMFSPRSAGHFFGATHVNSKTHTVQMFPCILLIFIAAGNYPTKLMAVLIREGDTHPKDGRLTEVTADEYEYSNATYADNEAHEGIGGDGETNPREVQKAVCTVTAGEVRASAEAVTTKTLKGVCGSVEMNLALKALELKFIKELQEIKTLLRQQIQYKEEDEIPPTNQPSNLLLKSIHSKESSAQTISREFEIKKFNNTMLSDEYVKIFTYYWKLENFTQSVKDNGSIVESPIFSIKGKSLRIRASFNHMHRDFLYLQLEYASFEKHKDNYKSNIFLDMGGGRLFREINDHQNSFKYKISILDKNNRSNDLVSQEFYNLENGFLIPISALISSPYAKNNSLLIQIIFHL